MIQYKNILKVEIMKMKLNLTNQLKWVLCLILAISMMSPSFSAQTITQQVNNASNVTSDFASLKAQIEAATTDIEIILAPGTYTFTSEIKNVNNIRVTLQGATDASGNIATFFELDPGVTVSSRFIRLEAGSLTLNNLSLTGVRSVGGGISAKHVTVYNASFTNNFTNDGVNGGGAIRTTGGALSVDKATFVKNHVGAYSDGGAISAENSGNVYINNSVFDGNERKGNNNQYGGAISIKQPSVANTTIVITNNVFKNNVLDATGPWTRGGAIHIYSSTKVNSVLIDRNLFENNKATNGITNNGGAIAFMDMKTKSVISNSTFINNSSTKYAGAVYYENSIGDNTIVNSTFASNATLLTEIAITAYSSSVKVDSSTLISNPLSTAGTGSLITISNSILTGTPTYASSTIVYSGDNIARQALSEEAIDAATYLRSTSASTLMMIDELTRVAPVRTTSQAYGVVSEGRLLPNAQNYRARKTTSDLGAYEAAIFAVTFDEGLTVPFDTQYVAEFEKATDYAQKPIKVGYNFGGWYTDEGTYLNVWDFNTTITEDMTLYAKWVPDLYTLTYDANGGHESYPSQSVAYEAFGDRVDDPTRTGYIFTGWNDQQDGQGNPWIYGSSTMPDTDLTVYAQWELDHYVIHFEPNGGYGEMADEIFVYGEEKPLFTNEFKNDHDHFLGWSTSPNGPVVYTDEALIDYELTNDLTLYAVWEVNMHPLTFNLNGGKGAIPTQTVAYDALAQAVTNPTRTDYIFTGWNTMQDGHGHTWDFSVTKMPDAPVTLYAQWEANPAYDTNHALSFDLNGGQGVVPASQSLSLDQLATPVTDPIREGHTFVSWNTSQDGSGTTWNFETSKMPAKDVTLYAQWSINSYQLRFDLNGGTSEPIADQMVVYGTKAVSVQAPSRTGYQFVSWNTTADGTGETWVFQDGKVAFASDTMMIATSSQVMPAHGVVLYAQWEKNKELPDTGMSSSLTQVGFMTGLLGIFFVLKNKKRIKA